MFSLSNLSAFSVDTVELIAKWSTISLIAVAIIVGVILFFTKRTVFKTYCRYAFYTLAACLILLALALFISDALYHYSQDYADENWLNRSSLINYLLLPVCAIFIVTAGACIAYAIVSKRNPDKKELTKTIGLFAVLVSFIVALVFIGIYYQKHIDGDGYYNSDSSSVKQIALYVSAALLIILLFALVSLEKEPLKFDTRSLAYAGVCASMSFALSYVKLLDMTAGGSITLASFLPLTLYAYVFGLKKGVFAGFVYSLLQAVQDPWLIHPAQFILDYPVAFTAIGLAGIFNKITAISKKPRLSFALGCTGVGLFRFIAHVLSGVFAFEASAEGQNVWLFSLAYNSYVFIDVAVVIVAGVLVLSSKTFLSVLKKTNAQPSLSE